MTYAETIRAALKAKGLFIRQLADSVAHSYEHCRKIVMGEPVVSRELNGEICRVLGLGEAEMWSIASKEKAMAKFGPAVLAGLLTAEEREFFAQWKRLNRSDRAILRRVAVGLSALSRQKTSRSTTLLKKNAKVDQL